MKNAAGLAAMLLIAATATTAAERTVVLKVPSMTCGTCPITGKKALTRLEGVAKVEVEYDSRQAVVTFDDAKASVAQLIHATSEAGYPSTVKGSTP